MEAATVYLVDDDDAVRAALARLLRLEGYTVVPCGSAEAYLATPAPVAPACLVLDVSMPGMDGLALQRRISGSAHALPVVFLTGRGSIPMTVEAMKAGAADFLTKPVEAARLLASVRGALERQNTQVQKRLRQADLEMRLGSLTPREREVLAGMAAGKLNKQIAADLGVVEQTIKFHRARIMERMQAGTVAELMHMLARAERAQDPGPGASAY